MAEELTRLRSYDVAPGGNSLSGLSSGGFMAVQMHLAHASRFIGAGVIAGGPYRCAQSFRDASFLAEDANDLNSLYICLSPLTARAGPDPERSVRLACETAAAGRIDPVEHLRDQRDETEGAGIRSPHVRLRGARPCWALKTRSGSIRSPPSGSPRSRLRRSCPGRGGRHGPRA